MAEEQKPIETAPQAPDIPAPQPMPEKDKDPNRWQQLLGWYKAHKRLSIPATVVVLLLLIMAIPFTRYGVSALVVKRDVKIKVVDATAATPVSGATVSIGKISAETDGSGTAVLHAVKAGHHQAQISKKYYASKTVGLLSPIFSQKTTPQVSLSATGRQIKVEVTNLINGKMVAGAVIKAAGTTAKTDNSGSATIVLPADHDQQAAAISHDGYNQVAVVIKVNGATGSDNHFQLTPAGKVYFLSNLSGNIDVVKTNLDGTDRQTVLAGTGHEDNNNTLLFASRDWKYLALLSRRAGNKASLYLINTTNDNLSTIDEGNADFYPDGWQGDNFVYEVSRDDVQLWQPGRQQIKSFSTTSNKATVLDQSSGSGTDGSDYISELISGVNIFNGQVFYAKNWIAGANAASDPSFTSKAATFNSVKTDGSAKKAIRSFNLASGTQALGTTLNLQVLDPQRISLEFSDGNNENFYIYANGQVKDDPSMTAEKFFGGDYPTYLESPSGDNTFWSEQRDGKNTLFVGDQNGQNGKQIATLSDYAPYGWYTDDYLLVSKNSSELYIMPPGGSKSPVKISDYHKPDYNFAGFGGGYGGF